MSISQGRLLRKGGRVGVDLAPPEWKGRECLDHLIIIGEDHLRRILRDYLDYYHNSN